MSQNISKYGKIFDKNSPLWSEDQESNDLYLRSTQMYFTDLLKVRGYVFLRDVYEMLGIPITKTSIFVGWHVKSDISDRYVDFGATLLNDGTYQLDFNVDGDITKYFED